MADVRKDASRSVLRRGPDAELAALEPTFAELEQLARAELAAEGLTGEAVTVERAIDGRYGGQSYELEVPASPDWREAFHGAHLQRFGFRRDDAVVEAVTLRVTARAHVARPQPARLAPAKAAPQPQRPTRVYVGSTWEDVSLYQRDALQPGHRLEGPAVIAEYSATTWVPPEWCLEVNESGDLLLSMRS